MQRKPRMGLFVFVAALTIVSSIGLWLATNEIKAPAKPNIDDYARAQPADRERVPPDHPTRRGHKKRLPSGEPYFPPVIPGNLNYAADAGFEGFPASRIRDRDGREPLQLDQRIIIRNAALATDGVGMQIRGSIFTDFFADSLPQGVPREPRQLPIRVRIRLHFYDVQVERSLNGEFRDEWLDPEVFGRPVPGQQVEVSTDPMGDGPASADFRLPYLSKPLAPGIYRLTAEINFAEQRPVVYESLRWCSDLFGKEMGVKKVRLDDGTTQVRVERSDVMDDPEKHSRWHAALIDEVGSVRNEAVLYVGQALDRNRVVLVNPAQEDPEQDYNHVFWTSYCDQLAYLARLEDEYEYWIGFQPRSEEDVHQFNRAMADLQSRITVEGGAMSPTERRYVETLQEAKSATRVQIADFQDSLRLKFWVIAQGHVFYGGWHSFNQPAYSCYDAIRRQEYPSEAPAFVDPEKWKEREYMWRYQPPGLTRVAFDYLRTKEETSAWHPRSFTLHDRSIQFDKDAWARFRREQLSVFWADVGGALKETRSDTYVTSPFYNSYHLVQQVAWNVAELTLSWEYYIRTELEDEGHDAVMSDLQAEVEQYPELFAGVDLDQCAEAPGKVKDRFDADMHRLEESINLHEFRMRWRTAVDDGKPLPGVDE